MRPRGLPFACLAAAMLLGACQQKAAVLAAPETAPVGLIPAAPPQGAGCGPEIARTQAVVDSDVSTENLDKAVGSRFSADLARASSACAAGRTGEALNQLSAAKARYGYR